MATCKELVDPLEQNQADILTCYICAVTYSDLKSMKFLPCGHMFCIKCLETLVKQSREKHLDNFECPLCRKKQNLPTVSVEDEWPHPHFLAKYLPFHQGSTCSACLQNGTQAYVKGANGSCNKCHEMCYHPCKTNDEIETYSKAMLPLSMADSVAVDKTRYCPIHKSRAVELFCKDCKESCCVTCMLSKHKFHDCVEYDEAAPEYRRLLQDQIHELDAVRDRVGNILARMKEAIISVQETAEQCTEQVNERAYAIIEDVKAYQKTLCNQIRREEKIFTDHVNFLFVKVESHVKDLGEVKRDITTVKENDVIEYYLKHRLCHEWTIARARSPLTLELPSSDMWFTHQESIKGLHVNVKDIFGQFVANPVATREIVKSNLRSSFTSTMIDRQLKNPFLATAGSLEIACTVFVFNCEVLFSLSCLASNEIVVGKSNEGYQTIHIHHKNGAFMQELWLSGQGHYDTACSGDIIYVSNSKSGLVAGYDKTSGIFQQVNCLQTQRNNGICVNKDCLYSTSCREDLLYRICLQDNIADAILFVSGIPEPSFVAADDNFVATSCSGRNLIFVFTATGSAHFVYGDIEKERERLVLEYGEEIVLKEGALDTPCGLAIDQQANIVVADFGNDRVVILSNTGEELGYIEVPKPEYIAFDSAGTLFVSSANKVYCIDYN